MDSARSTSTSRHAQALRAAGSGSAPASARAHTHPAAASERHHGGSRPQTGAVVAPRAARGTPREDPGDAVLRLPESLEFIRYIYFYNSARRTDTESTREPASNATATSSSARAAARAPSRRRSVNGEHLARRKVQAPRRVAEAARALSQRPRRRGAHAADALRAGALDQGAHVAHTNGRDRAYDACPIPVAACVDKYQIPNTKYTCDTGQTRNKLLEQWVHLANHAAGHSRPGTTHQTA